MDIKVAGNKLIVTLDLIEEGGDLSGSGKNYTVASTHGFVEVAGKPGFTLSLNLCRKNATYVKSSKK